MESRDPTRNDRSESSTEPAITDDRPVDITTVGPDSVVIHQGASVRTFDDLTPGTVVNLDGIEVETLPQYGELLARFATVNDVHFGETECGHIDGVSEAAGWATYTREPGESPYPELMNDAAIHEIGSIDVDAVLVKGDLTSNGTEDEFNQFYAAYHGAFGDKLTYVRGNHESYHSMQHGAIPFQEVVLPGVTLVLLDTSRDERVNGDFSAEQLEQLDEFAARSDQPVLVFGHHPTWHPTQDFETDDVFGLVPKATRALYEVMDRRRNIVGYFAGHTHRNRVVGAHGTDHPLSVEVACVKDFPGTWAEYRIYEGNIVQIHHRISTPDALAWSEQTRGMFGGLYDQYAFGALSDRCFSFATDH